MSIQEQMTTLLLLFLLPLVACSSAPWLRRDPVSLANRWRQHVAAQSEEAAVGMAPPKYKWTEEWLDAMPIDHFSFADKRTFRLRYLVNTEHFVQKNAPIFFYTGNEGGIEGFAENTGFMWDIAPEFGAAVVFAEHRFYGKTQPFGNASYASLTNLGYLSSEQALADFAVLIDHLKTVRLPAARNSPVIAFGGSYGGMLTAWMRIKYPHLVDGGIAASAPVFWFVNVPSPPEDAYDRIVTRTFKLSGCTVVGLRASFSAIRELCRTEEGRAFINDNFHLAPESRVERPSDAETVVGALKDTMETLAMVDYPYESNFLAPLPGWPIREVCKVYARAKSQKGSALAAYQMLNLYYNYTGTTKTLCLSAQCPGPFSQLGDPDGWPWQACTEMIMPMCSQGTPRDPFNHTCPADLARDNLRYCVEHFARVNFSAELFRPRWAITNYGAEFPTATNIVFSNGWLDPWSGGGWRLRPGQQGSLVSLIVEDGAHHYDLRGAHPADTDAVKEVRRIEKMHISRWVQEARRRHRAEKQRLREHLLRTELTGEEQF